MRKWKRDFPSKKIKARMCNEAGFTLVELLASLALLSIVIGLIGSVTMFGLKQYEKQTNSVAEANDFAYALTVLSKEIRAAETVTVTGNTLTVDDVAFSQDGTQLMQSDGRVLVEGLDPQVSLFEQSGDGIKITLKSNSGQGDSHTYETTVYSRR